MTLSKIPVKKRKVSTKPVEGKVDAKGKKMNSFVNIVTWALVVVFGISCVGIIVGGSFGQKGQAPGTAEHGKANVQKDIEDWQKRVNEDPNDANAYANLAAYYRQAFQIEKAIYNYKKAIELDPKFAIPYAHLADIYFAKKDFKQAAALGEKAVNLSPDNRDYRLSLFNYYVASRKLDSAINQEKEIIKRDPENAESYAVIAELFFRGKYSKEAFEMIDSALKKFKDDKRVVSFFQNMKKEMEKKEKK
ncbi:MAG: tetratricopeptide repeat protein [Firmicutes bacterium]|nr:tetratricopeptide repeat protein [Bacillota bacterium]